MNRKYEFASYELVRLESKNYSWDERKKDKTKQVEDAHLKSYIDSFIKVMKCVHNPHNKRKKLLINYVPDQLLGKLRGGKLQQAPRKPLECSQVLTLNTRL